MWSRLLRDLRSSTNPSKPPIIYPAVCIWLAARLQPFPTAWCHDFVSFMSTAQLFLWFRGPSGWDAGIHWGCPASHQSGLLRWGCGDRAEWLSQCHRCVRCASANSSQEPQKQTRYAKRSEKEDMGLTFFWRFAEDFHGAMSVSFWEWVFLTTYLAADSVYYLHHEW